MLDIFSGLGPAGYLALGLGLMALAASLVVPVLIGVMRWEVPATIAWAPTVACMIAGMLGVMQGTGSVLHVAAAAPAELQKAVLARGTADAIGAITVACGLAGVAMILFSASIALPTSVLTGPQSRLQWKSALGGLMGGALGLVGALLGLVFVVGTEALASGSVQVLVLPACALGLGATTMAASLRESEDYGHQGRIAGSRFAMLTSGALGLLLLGEFSRYIDFHAVLQAVSLMASDQLIREVFTGRFIEHTTVGPQVAVWCALIPSLAGIGGMARGIRRLEGRQLLGAALAGVQVLLILSCVSFASVRIGRNIELILAAS